MTPPPGRMVTIHLPPLRERGRDVILLAEHFLAQFCLSYGVPAKTLSDDAQTALVEYVWPGNVREVANTIERPLALGAQEVITREDLGLPLPAGRR